MRPARLVLSLFALALLSIGCGIGVEGAAATGEPTGAEGAFPVTIEHKFGSTEITDPPQRIVTVGLTDHDALLALGIVPVGVTEWYGNHPFATWPWARDELSDATPVVVGDSSAVNYEAVAAQDP
ncbi:MAG: iron-siderophore ABC transporter substrate-binding protein, partial [Pseudonocardiaceae bacterium]